MYTSKIHSWFHDSELVYMVSCHDVAKIKCIYRSFD